MKLRIHFIVLFMFVFVFGTIARAQNKYVKQITGARKHTLLSMASFPADSTYYSAGFSLNSLNVEKPVLIKSDKFGNILWTKIYDFSVPNHHDQRFLKIIYSSSSKNFYVAGIFSNDTSAFNDESYSFVCIIDTAGNVILNKKYKPLSDILIYDLVTTSDSGCAAIGMYNFLSPALGTDTISAFLIKFDKNLNQQWVNFYSNSISLKGISLIQLPDSGFFYSGAIKTDSSLASHLAVVRTDKYGIIIWSKCTNLLYENVSGYDQYAVMPNDTEIAITSLNYGGGVGADRVELLKLDLAGNVLLYKALPSNGSATNGGFYISADGGYNILMNRAFIARYDLNGIFVSSQLFNPGPVNFIYFSILSAFDKGSIISGYGNLTAGGGGVILKTDSFGNFGCNTQQLNGPFSYNTNSNFVSVQLHTKSDTLTNSALTYTFTDTLVNSVDFCANAVELFTNELAAYSIQPNPSQGLFHIKGPFKNTLSVEVFNSFGEMIFKDLLESSALILDLSQFKPGLFLLRLSSNNNTSRTIKLLKL